MSPTYLWIGKSRPYVFLSKMRTGESSAQGGTSRRWRHGEAATMKRAIAVMVMMSMMVMGSSETTLLGPDSPCALDPDADLPFTAELSPGNFHLSWAFDSDQIVLEAQVRTRGWVGLGLSSTGTMAGSDVVVGWVDSAAATHLVDAHIEGERSLVRDASQDYKLVRLSENGTHTVMRVVRALRTCDANDRDITENTMRLIWASEDNDPKSEAQITYHGPMDRGTKSLQLLSSRPRSQPELPQDRSTFDIVQDKCAIPPDSTFYACKIFSLPNLSKKHHLVEVEPIIDPGSEALVHHMVVYMCPDTVNASHVGVTHQCYLAQLPDSFSTCTSVLAAWAIGGGTFEYPPAAGYSLGVPGDPRFVLLEIHYNNPNRSTGIEDSSGLRFHYTAQLRRFDAGHLMAGIIVSPFHFIPPNTDSFATYGICDTNSFSTLNRNGETQVDGEMQVFASCLHSHLAGISMQARHFRNGTQIGDVGREQDYDFKFQETRHLKKLVTVLPGDKIVVECVYRTTNRNKTTLGGMTTEDEMCLAFLHYYPKVNVSMCHSMYDVPSMAALLGYTTTGIYPYVITSPAKDMGSYLFMVFNEINWTAERTRDAERTALTSQQLIIQQHMSSVNLIYDGIIPRIPADPTPPPCVHNKCGRNGSLPATTAASPTAPLLATLMLLLLARALCD
uniref:DBH-like monooxygenase protein 1 homolog isoform X1 n=2 Tax=Petromyzon marinus TaxID=7757 RepID=A0AAJ7TJ86_PETMA|nr:DBH-like monooxygenase protein 1 homolog isoform X1 [Petromyzon marinus]